MGEITAVEGVDMKEKLKALGEESTAYRWRDCKEAVAEKLELHRNRIGKWNDSDCGCDERRIAHLKSNEMFQFIDCINKSSAMDTLLTEYSFEDIVRAIKEFFETDYAKCEKTYAYKKTRKESEKIKDTRYQRKPITVEARQLDEENYVLLFCWLYGCDEDIEFIMKQKENFKGLPIYNYEGTQVVRMGDYIIKDEKGRFSPCPPVMFDTMYEKVKEE